MGQFGVRCGSLRLGVGVRGWVVVFRSRWGYLGVVGSVMRLDEGV